VANRGDDDRAFWDEFGVQLIRGTFDLLVGRLLGGSSLRYDGRRSGGVSDWRARIRAFLRSIEQVPTATEQAALAEKHDDHPGGSGSLEPSIGTDTAIENSSAGASSIGERPTAPCSSFSLTPTEAAGISQSLVPSEEEVADGRSAGKREPPAPAPAIGARAHDGKPGKESAMSSDPTSVSEEQNIPVAAVPVRSRRRRRPTRIEVLGTVETGERGWPLVLIRTSDAAGVISTRSRQLTQVRKMAMRAEMLISRWSRGSASRWVDRCPAGKAGWLLGWLVRDRDLPRWERTPQGRWRRLPADPPPAPPPESATIRNAAGARKARAR
jgi:hypothetical protein